MKLYKLGSFPILKSSGCRVVNFGWLKRTLTEIPCTLQRCGEQEPAANRTKGRTEAAQPGLSRSSGKEETENLARVYFYSNVREEELVPVAKFGSALHSVPPWARSWDKPIRIATGITGLGTECCQGSSRNQERIEGNGGDTNLW